MTFLTETTYIDRGSVGTDNAGDAHIRYHFFKIFIAFIVLLFITVFYYGEKS